MQACMDVAIEYAQYERQRLVEADSPSEETAEEWSEVQVSPGGQPNDIPYQAHAETDVVIGRIMLDVRDMSARCVGLAALRPEHWDAIIARVRSSSGASTTGLRGERGAQWLQDVRQSVLSGGEGPEAVDGEGAAKALLPVAGPAARTIGVVPAREAAGTVAELWAGDTESVMTDEEQELASILGLKQGDNGGGDGTSGAGPPLQATEGPGADDAAKAKQRDIESGRRAALLIAAGAVGGKHPIEERRVPDVSDRETFAAGTLAMAELQRLRNIDGMTMGQCMHELSWRTPTRCALLAEFLTEERRGGTGAWGADTRLVGPGAVGLLQAPADQVEDAADEEGEASQVSEDVIVQQWLAEKRREVADGSTPNMGPAPPPPADVSDVLVQLSLELPSEERLAQAKEANDPKMELKTKAARRAQEAAVRVLGAQAEEYVHFYVRQGRGALDVLYDAFDKELNAMHAAFDNEANPGGSGGAALQEAVVHSARASISMLRAALAVALMEGSLTLDTPRRAAAVSTLLSAVAAEVRATYVNPAVEHLAESPAGAMVEARMVAVRGGAASSVALAVLMDSTEEACGAFSFQIDKVLKGDAPEVDDQQPFVLADRQVAAARRRFRRAFEDLLELPRGTLVDQEDNNSAAAAFAEAVNAAPAAPIRSSRPPRQRALGAGAATLRGGSRGGAKLTAAGGGASTSAPWMRGLSDEQVAEYYLRQRREFDQVMQMLEGRVSAREARARNGEAVLDGLSDQDRTVVEEQEAVLQEVRRNRAQLDRLVSERLGVPAAGLANASTAAEVLSGGEPEEEVVPGNLGDAVEAAWDLLAAVLVEPGVQERPSVQQVMEYMKAQGESTAVALSDASGALDMLELPEGSSTGSEAARSQALERLKDRPRRTARLATRGTNKAGNDTTGKAEEYMELLKDADAQKVDQVCYPFDLGALAMHRDLAWDGQQCGGGCTVARVAAAASGTMHGGPGVMCFAPALRGTDSGSVAQQRRCGLCAVQMCWELVQRVSSDGPGWLSAMQTTGLDRTLFELLRAPPKPVPAAAAVFKALAANNPPGVASQVLGQRLPELVAVLAAGLSARGSAADAALRYECMLALVPLITTLNDRETAGQLALARACTLLREADLEAEQCALLDLLAVLCIDCQQHTRQITFQNILPRLQQLMGHPDHLIQRSAVRFPNVPHASTL